MSKTNNLHMNEIIIVCKKKLKIKWRVELYIKALYNNEWVDGLIFTCSFRSKLDLQRHKQVRKNTFPFIDKGGNGSIKTGTL